MTGLPDYISGSTEALLTLHDQKCTVKFDLFLVFLSRSGHERNIDQ